MGCKFMRIERLSLDIKSTSFVLTNETFIFTTTTDIIKVYLLTQFI